MHLKLPDSWVYSMVKFIVIGVPMN